MELIIIRHAITTWNLEHRFQGQYNTYLDGRDIHLLKDSIVKLNNEYLVTRIIASDLLRAQDTAGVISSVVKLPVILDVRLREIKLGVWEGMLRKDVIDKYPQLYKEWRLGYIPNIINGETEYNIKLRIKDIIKDIESNINHNDTYILVTHGYIIKILLQCLLKCENNIFMTLSNCHHVILRSVNNVWQLLKYNNI